MTARVADCFPAPRPGTEEGRVQSPAKQILEGRGGGTAPCENSCLADHRPGCCSQAPVGPERLCLVSVSLGGPTGPPQPCVIWGLLPEALYPTPAILPLLKGVWAVPSSPACSDAQSLELIMAGGFRWFLGVPLDNSIAQ